MEYEKGFAHIWREAQRRRGAFFDTRLRQIWLRSTYRTGVSYYMNKTMGVSIVIILAVAVVAIWIKPGTVTGQAAALTEPIKRISP